MKSLTLSIVLAIIINANGLSQSCLPEGITFVTQEQIDNFQTNYPGCTEIEGDVVIKGDSINNLNGLNVLTAIWGYLWIGNASGGNPLLTNLTGLDNLTSIGQDLWIRNNSSLVDLTGLGNLTSIGQSLKFWFNDALIGLTGLENLTSVEWNLSIQQNNALLNLTGLDNVTSIGVLLEIWANA